MGLFSFIKRTGINDEVRRYRETAGAKLIDVRSPEEYRNGNIPGSINIPLHDLKEIEKKVPLKSSPLFVYCLSGARSGRAVSALKKMGYETVTNIGGIASYKGELER